MAKRVKTAHYRIHQMSITQFEAQFPHEDACKAYLMVNRWPDGVVRCPRCGFEATALTTKPYHWQCYQCAPTTSYRFSVLVDTIFENTNKPLREWFRVMHLMLTSKKGISALQIFRYMGFGSYKTAWLMCSKIRVALGNTEFKKLIGYVEIDETYVGGSLKNIHASKKEKLNLKRGDNKTMVFGAIQRGGKGRTKVIPQATLENVSATIEGFVALDSIMVTDEHHAYNKVGQKYNHKKVNHRNKEYVRKEDILVHTNNIEGYWNILKKQIDGIHHSVSPKHLQRYCNESAFRFNSKTLFQDERFANVLANCQGSLKYKVLTGKL